jgi:hypothetical protein
MPADCAAGFEKLFLIASILVGFHDAEGKYEGTEHDQYGLS